MEHLMISFLRFRNVDWQQKDWLAFVLGDGALKHSLSADSSALLLPEDELFARHG